MKATIFDCLLKSLGSGRVSVHVPQERRPGFRLRALLNAELPGSHRLLARKNPSPGLFPRRKTRPTRVDISDALPHLIEPCRFELRLCLPHAVKELERQDGALRGRESLRVLEELVGAFAHDL
jgi:hypothetical protein